ncbi:MAG: sigma-70 family RNA polymerase sigma factor [Planctomycetota bacterium]|nr:sigma-70 family RNA polymerase sigma factor [Planctomycetota bacterium]
MADSTSNSGHGLLQRVSLGDKAAMRELLTQYGPLVWSMARSFTHSAADAEDAAQDVFVHLWKKAGQYDPALGQEVQFISVLTRRRLIDWVRTHSKPDAAADRFLDEQPRSPTRERAETDDEAVLAMEVMSQLGAEQRTALTLSIVRGLTHDQIARHLQVPLGTVKTNIYRGLALLRDAITSRGTRAGATLRPGAGQRETRGAAT